MFLAADGVFLAGQIASATDERVELARKFSMLKTEGSGIAQIFMHPENLFLVSNQLYVAHRGLTGSVEPKEFNFKRFFKHKPKPPKHRQP